MTKALSSRYVADEFTLKCKGPTQWGEIDYDNFTTQLQSDINDRRFKVHFIAKIGNFVKFKFAGVTYTLQYDYDTDSWIPE